MAQNVIRYKGKQESVTWDSRLCIHVGECGRAAGDLFVAGRKPWCDPDLASPEEAKDVVSRCPTGALARTRPDGTVVEESAPAENTIHVAADGPLYVSGDLDIDGAEQDMPSVKWRAALCRCGASSAKPFCDGSHKKMGFDDSGAIGGSKLERKETGGQLKVGRTANGPLIVKGNVTLYSGAGRQAWQGEFAALCRCGASKTKPFCDGSHSAAGFEAD